MERQAEFTNNDVPVFDMLDYFGWRSKMKACLKKFGIWKIVVNPPTQSNKTVNSAAQKDTKKDNTISLKFLMDGLSSSVRESLGEHTSAKDLWFKLESEYQGRNQDTKIEAEVKSTKDESKKKRRSMHQTPVKVRIFLITVAVIVITLKMILKKQRKMP